MSAKTLIPAALVLTVLGLGAARGQAPSDTSLPQYGGPSAEPPSPPVTPPGRLSHWITYERPDCCGPLGADGPVYQELYLRSGASFPVGAKIFGKVLQTGWVVDGGGRSLFFNPEQDAVWVIDLGVSNIHYPGERPDLQFKLLHILVPTAANPLTGQAGTAIINFVPHGKLTTKMGKNGAPNTVTEPFGVTVANLNQTFVNVGGGREWYLWGAANCGEPNWRVGFDVGGRYGTEKLNLHQLRHRTDTIAGLYIAAHSDIECPCGCCTYFAGVRVEYDYIWGDILQEQNVADTETIGLLFTAGVRF